MMKLSAALLLLTLGLLPWGVVGAQNDVKIANRTIERTVSLRTHSLYAPYIDQDLQNRWWDFGADAYVNTNKHIRLTRDRSSQMGWLWSRLPLTSTNFIVEVEFKIGGGDSNHLFGDGMGIWLTTGRAQPGPVFGNADQWEGLGIVLDTYANSRHSYAFPRIYAFNGDGKTKYDKDNDGDSQALAACSANFRRTNVATKMKITYIKGAYLNLKVQYKAWDEWTECLTLPNFELPNAPFLGFTAETGDVSDSHDIISVTAYSAILSDPNAPKDKLVGAQPLKTPSTWLSSLFKFILFIGVIAGAMFGYNKYQLSKLSARSPLAYGGRSPSGFGGGLYADAKRF